MESQESRSFPDHLRLAVLESGGHNGEGKCVGIEADQADLWWKNETISINASYRKLIHRKVLSRWYVTPMQIQHKYRQDNKDVGREALLSIC